MQRSSTVTHPLSAFHGHCNGQDRTGQDRIWVTQVVGRNLLDVKSLPTPGLKAKCETLEKTGEVRRFKESWD